MSTFIGKSLGNLFGVLGVCIWGLDRIYSANLVGVGPRSRKSICSSWEMEGLGSGVLGGGRSRGVFEGCLILRFLILGVLIWDSS